MRHVLKRCFFTLLVMALVITGSGFSFIPPLYAAVTEAALANNASVINKVRPGQIIYPVKFTLTANAGETFNALTFILAQSAGTVTASDFNDDGGTMGGASVLLFRDANNNDILDDQPVARLIGNGGVTVGSAMTLTLDTDLDSGNGSQPDTLPSSEAGTWNYMLGFVMDASASNGDAFTVSFANTTAVYTLSAGTVTSSGLTTSAITVDTTAPTAIADGQPGSGGPSNGFSNAPTEAFVDRGFSESLLPSSANTTNVTLKANTGNVQGGAPAGANLCANVFLDNGTRVVCEHLSDNVKLDASTWYTLTITTGVTDIAGNPLASNFVTQFRTNSFVGGSANNPPPFVQGTVPQRGQTLSTNGKIIVNFSRPMNSSSGDGMVLDINNIQLFALDTTFTPTGSNLFLNTTGWTWDATKMELKITPPSLTASTQYRLIIKADNNNNPGDGSCGGGGEPACVMSTDNLALQGGNFNVDFRATASDSTPPTVTGVFPQHASTGVDRATYDIGVSFNEPLDPSTVTNVKIKLIPDLNSNDTADDTALTNVNISLDRDARSVHITPSGLLVASTKFFVKIVSGVNGVKDSVGNALVADIEKSFTTGTNINGGASDSTGPKVEFANGDNQGIFVTFNEPLKYGYADNVNMVSSSGANDINNASLITIEMSSDSGTSWQTVSLVDQNGGLLTGKTIKYEPHFKTLQIQGLAMNPNTLFRVTVSTSVQDLSGNAMDSSNRIASGTVKSAQSTGGNLGPGGGGQSATDFFTFGTNPVKAFPRNGRAGSTTDFEIAFGVTTAVPGSGLIKLTFPSGFSFDTTNADATKRCTSLPTSTFENNDLNGPGTGTVTVSSITCDSVSRVVTLTLGATGVQANDQVRFLLQGVLLSTVPKDPSTSGYTVDIKTYNGTTLLESKTSMPFFSSTPGSRTASGKVFVDNGAGGGTASNNIPDGTESGVQSVKVCLGGPSGFNCATTDSNGAFSFTQLGDGFYHIDIPPLTSGSYTGGPFFKDLNISGSNITNVYFPVQEVTNSNILNVEVTGSGLNGTKVDVFAFQGGGSVGGAGPQPSRGFVVRECTIGTDCDNLQIPLAVGNWEVGVGPRMPKDLGVTTAPPDFNFVPPRPVQVTVTNSGVPDACGGVGGLELCFALTGATNQIKGKVVDGSGSAISNVFVSARPSFTEKASGPSMAGVAQSDSKGNFSLKIKGGETYLVDAFIPGMPPSQELECTVKDDTGNDGTDRNSTADVYCKGVLQVNDISGFSDSSLTIASLTSNDLVLIIAKGDTSVSGRVLDVDSNAIAYAHVQAQEVNSNTGIPSGGWADAPTDASGNYTLYVKGGTWKIRAFAPGFGELPSISVAVTQGVNITDKNLQVIAGGFYSVSGTLTQNSTGVSGANIHAYGPCGGNGTVTDSSGNYTLKLRATGSCTSAVGDDEGYMIEGQTTFGPTSTITSRAVTGDLTGQNLTIAQTGTLMVYICTIDTPGSSPSAVNNCNSGAVTTAFVDARDSNGKGVGTRSNPTSGEYEMSLPAGTYRVKAGEAGAGALGTQSNVTITAGVTTYINIAPPTFYQVSGTVTSLTTSCIEGSTIFLNDQTNGRLILAQVASDGTWSATNVPNGTYSVGAGKPSCVDSADSGSITVSGANLTQVGDSDLARTLVLSNMVVSGRVLLSATNVDFETMVFATSSGGKTVVAKVDISKTGSDNNYTLNLTSGTTWTIKARADGYESSGTTASSASSSTNLTVTAISGYTRQEPQPYTVKPSRGGVVKNDDIGDDFELNIPAGTLGSSTNDGSVVTKETTAVADTATQKVVGQKGVEITPKDASGQPIKTLSSSSSSFPTVTLSYEEADVTEVGGDETKLLIGAWSEDKQSWEAMPTTCDATANTCTATVSHFSTFGTISASSSSSSSTGSSSDFFPPALPTQVSYVSLNDSVTMTWKDPLDSDFELVEILRNAGTGTLVHNESIAYIKKGIQKYTDLSVKAGETYIYRLRVRDFRRNRAMTPEQSVTVKAATAPGTGVHGTNKESTEEIKTKINDTVKKETNVPDSKVETIKENKIQTRESQINQIVTESSVVVLGNVDQLINFLKRSRKLEYENQGLTIVKRALQNKLPAEDRIKDSFVNFVAYGTPTTDKLGAGERAGVVNSYKEAFGSLPSSNQDWEDVIKIANGRWPSKASPQSESRAKLSFKSIYLREPNMKNANDNAAVTIMAYGLRSDSRNFNSEKVAIKAYKKIFGHDPVTATAWDAVRAIAYSGAKR